MGLSDMFGSRIMGKRQNDDTPEIKLKSDIDIDKNQSSVFDELKIKTMAEKKDKVFDFINTKHEILKPQVLNNKETTMKLNTYKFNELQMPKEFNMKKMKKNYSKKQKMPKGIDMNKLKSNFSNIEKAAFSNIVKRPDMIGMRRVRNQAKLNLWGDVDGDKVANVLDCRPFDKTKQGAQHTFEKYFGNRRVDTPVGTLQTFKDTLPVQQEESKPTQVEVIPEYYGTQNLNTSSYQESKPTTLQKVGQVLGTGLKEVGQTGLEVVKAPVVAAKNVAEFGLQEVKDAWDRNLQRREIRQEAFKKAAETAGQLEAEAIYKEEQRKQLEKLYPKIRATNKQYNKQELVYDPISRSYVRVLPATQKRKSVRQEVSQSVSPFALGQQVESVLGTQSSGQGVYRAVESVGQRPVESKVITMVQGGQEPEMPQQQMAPQQQTQTPQVSPQYDPEQGVYSPYSKRKVTYTRGPYKKRMPVQQQYPQQ